jgi:predicted RNase H-like nuclease (RuvC/YqgF family)
MQKMKGEIKMIDELKALENEIETLNKNIERKNNIIAGLYSIIVSTNHINLIAEAGKIMQEANFENE